MRLHGWKVVYDVHEDVYLDIAQKDYLGKIARRVFPYLFRTIEQAVIHPFGFHVVNAERAYKVRYPQGVEILNYPKQAEKNINNDRDDYNKINLIYTGVLVIDRGAFLFKELLNIDPNIHITVIGKCSHELRQKILNDCKSYKRQLSLFTTPEGMPFDDITTLYERGNWTAGLAVFPDTAFYRDKELTKFFEYIQYSIPVLSSNFPTWSSLIEDQNIGLCIDPKDISGSFPKALTLFRDSKKWCILRDNCKSISKKYSWESQQKKLIYLYKKIC
jgi:glycosyltransferase involved in cell wall biosynthesis